MYTTTMMTKKRYKFETRHSSDTDQRLGLFSFDTDRVHVSQLTSERHLPLLGPSPMSRPLPLSLLTAKREVRMILGAASE